MGGADTAALAGRTVIAHRLSAQAQGAVDSVRSDAAGRFRFRIADPESATVYVVSTRYAGIGYFSEPFTREARDGADAIALAVFDTASTGAPLAVAIRHIVVPQADSAGWRRVLDLIQLHNPDVTTRVGADSAAPVWRGRVPDGVVQPEVGEGEIPASAVRFEGDRVLLLAAVPPGPKQLVLTYRLAPGARQLRVPVDQPTARFEVLLEDRDATATSELAADEPLTLEGRRFTHFTASGLAAGASPTIRFARPRSGGVPVAIIVVATAAALAAGAVIQWRRRGAALAPADAAASADALLAAIVALDERYGGREAQVGPAAWAEYQHRRRDLKAKLAARLARA